jgi:hypothetical protein
VARVTDRRMLLGALLLAVGWTALGLLVQRAGTGLGVATPPFVIGWSPRIDPWVVAAVAAGVALVAAGPALARASLPVYLGGTTGLSLALALSINASRVGAHGWSAVFDDASEARNEYLPGLPALSYGRHFFLDRFSELVPALAPSVAAHPPGLLLLLDATGITTPAGLAALCIGAAVAVAPLTYLLGRGLARGGEGSRRAADRPRVRRARGGGGPAARGGDAAPASDVGPGAGLGPVSVTIVSEAGEAGAPDGVERAPGPLPVHDERTARVAGLLAAASPALLLFGVTSADAVYAALGTAAAALLVRRSWRARGAGAVVLAVGALGTWSLPAIGGFAVVVAWRRAGWRDAAAPAATCAIALVVVNAVLAGAYGYDPVGALRAAEAVYRRSTAEVRPAWFWSVGSPVAWAVTAGLPITAAWLVAGRRRDPAALALVVVILVAAVAGFTRAETERSWLLFVPPACAAAATVIPPRALRPVLAALVLQALITQVLFETVW